jgi:hypothetical protein
MSRPARALCLIGFMLAGSAHADDCLTLEQLRRMDHEHYAKFHYVSGVRCWYVPGHHIRYPIIAVPSQLPTEQPPTEHPVPPQSVPQASMAPILPLAPTPNEIVKERFDSLLRPPADIPTDFWSQFK